MTNYQELLIELERLEKLAQANILKGVDANSFDNKMRSLDISGDSNIDEITAGKFKQRQEKISTIYSGRDGYTGGGFLAEWREYIEIFCGETYNKTQTYFSEESEEDVLEELGKLFKSANSHIGIYDNYFDKKILWLIANNFHALEIRVLTNKGVVDVWKLITAFNLLYENKKIEVRKYNFSHDRFYIIDDTVYSLGTSLQRVNRATLFTKLAKEESKKFLLDFNEGWNNSEPFEINEP